MLYKDKLSSILKNKRSHLVVGLDTDVRKIPEFFLGFPNPILEFNKAVVSSTSDIVAGYKLNSAFYEAAGLKGLEALSETSSFIPDDCVKIIDAKRGDIENTAEQYAKIFFDEMGFDAITISPYMGEDSVRPFFDRKDKFVYILALTSNPGSSDFQTLKSDNKFLFEIVIEKALKWDNERVGFVIGANHTEVLNNVTSNYNELALLIPGIGAQGNDIEDLMKNLNTEMFVINASRSVIYSAPVKSDESNFTQCVRNSAKELNDKIISFKIGKTL